jgi:hypothetical protein
VDRRREQGSNPREIEELQSRFQVDAFPTLVVYSVATGKAVRSVATPVPDETTSWVLAAAASVR